jgi:hypothetical protein
MATMVPASAQLIRQHLTGGVADLIEVFDKLGAETLFGRWAEAAVSREKERA